MKVTKRLWIRTALGAAAAAALAGTALAQQGQPVKIGLLATLEGPFAAGGADGMRGAELAVIDTWQGDVQRDSRTLSGGESFLVSLALALALSDLVSHKTRIDSLFLDEGFGTLDGATLDIALDALDSLHASGKMIGIISHVEALKERMPVQIRVHKGSGLGYSRLDNDYTCGQG